MQITQVNKKVIGTDQGALETFAKSAVRGFVTDENNHKQSKEYMRPGKTYTVVAGRNSGNPLFIIERANDLIREPFLYYLVVPNYRM
jgi:hypothetical protein